MPVLNLGVTENKTRYAEHLQLGYELLFFSAFVEQAILNEVGKFLELTALKIVLWFRTMTDLLNQTIRLVILSRNTF